MVTLYSMREIFARNLKEILCWADGATRVPIAVLSTHTSLLFSSHLLEVTFRGTWRDRRR